MEESVRNERKAKIRSKNMPFIQWLGMILLIVLALLTIIPFYGWFLLHSKQIMKC